MVNGVNVSGASRMERRSSSSDTLNSPSAFYLERLRRSWANIDSVDGMRRTDRSG